MRSFLELSDGGVVPAVLPAARRVFGRMLEEAAQNPDPEAAGWVRRMRSSVAASHVTKPHSADGIIDGCHAPLARQELRFISTLRHDDR